MEVAANPTQFEVCLRSRSLPLKHRYTEISPRIGKEEAGTAGLQHSFLPGIYTLDRVTRARPFAQ